MMILMNHLNIVIGYIDKGKIKMKHSIKFKKVKEYYEKHMWSIDMVHEAVNKWITKEEYKEITGVDFK